MMIKKRKCSLFIFVMILFEISFCQNLDYQEAFTKDNTEKMVHKVHSSLVLDAQQKRIGTMRKEGSNLFRFISTMQPPRNLSREQSSASEGFLLRATNPRTQKNSFSDSLKNRRAPNETEVTIEPVTSGTAEMRNMKPTMVNGLVSLLPKSSSRTSLKDKQDIVQRKFIDSLQARGSNRTKRSIKAVHDDPPESSDFIVDEPYLIPDIDSSESAEDSTVIPVITNGSFLLNEDFSYENKAFKMLNDKNVSFETIMEEMRINDPTMVDSNEDSENSTIENTTEEIFDEKLDIVTAFENFPHLNRLDLQDNGKHKIELDSPRDSFSTPMNNLKSVADDDSKNGSEHRDNVKVKAEDHTTKAVTLPSIPETLNTTQKISGSGHDLLDLELSGHAFKKLPNKEKKDTSLVISLIVSAVIGIVFVIFIGFIWRQNRRKRSVSGNSYQVMEEPFLPATIFQPRNISNFILAEFSSRIPTQRNQHIVTSFSSNSSLLNLPEHSEDVMLDDLLVESY